MNVMHKIANDDKPVEFVVSDVFCGLRQYLKNQGCSVYQNPSIMEKMFALQVEIGKHARDTILAQRGVDENGVLEMQS